ncbi:hypothetical protein D8674_027087 [Pyrus ussuriensis x Pyrus communis]|uniref:BSD domain-containing protein n=1 Tax=Pyrus ussuriensis x Pyrus communis TaxID=2448454 RepID=A0A5N5IBS9_9ROSA|nr:hypothetical protein D8674_027087 [Pyrus ussuriensis x Pyrus communis]
MDLSSWFRRKLLKNSEKTSNPDPSEQTLLPQQNEREEEQLGVTERLVDLVKSFTLDTFRNFRLPDDEGAEEDEDLSGWQERHATIVLSRVKELSHLRYKLCPRYLKERQFWRVYFMLVKKHVAELVWKNESNKHYPFISMNLNTQLSVGIGLVKHIGLDCTEIHMYSI